MSQGFEDEMAMYGQQIPTAKAGGAYVHPGYKVPSPFGPPLDEPTEVDVQVEGDWSEQIYGGGEAGRPVAQPVDTPSQAPELQDGAWDGVTEGRPSPQWPPNKKGERSRFKPNLSWPKLPGLNIFLGRVTRGGKYNYFLSTIFLVLLAAWPEGREVLVLALTVMFYPGALLLNLCFSRADKEHPWGVASAVIIAMIAPVFYSLGAGVALLLPVVSYLALCMADTPRPILYLNGGWAGVAMIAAIFVWIF